MKVYSKMIGLLFAVGVFTLHASQNATGGAPADNVPRYGNISQQVFRMFTDEGQGREKRIIAWIEEDLEVNKNAIRNRASEGKTLLMLAIELGEKGIADYLLSKQVDTLFKDVQNRDALDVLMYYSGFDDDKENKEFASNLIALMIKQGAKKEDLLARARALQAKLEKDQKRVGDEMEKTSWLDFMAKLRHKERLKGIRDLLVFIEFIQQELNKQ